MAQRDGSLFGWFHRSRRAIACALVLALGPFMFGCYGPFLLTKAVHKVNGGVPVGIFRQIVFWVFLPAYGVAVIGDMLVMNLIDFWTGVPSAVAMATDEQGNTIALTPSADGREAVLTVTRPDGTAQQVRFVRLPDGVSEAYDSSGNLLGRATCTPAGGLDFSDAGGRLVASLSAQEIQQARAAHALTVNQ
jgi:hypothetical protein